VKGDGLRGAAKDVRVFFNLFFLPLNVHLLCATLQLTFLSTAPPPPSPSLLISSSVHFQREKQFFFFLDRLDEILSSLTTSKERELPFARVWKVPSRQRLDVLPASY
jgi:hypothetical protein